MRVMCCDRMGEAIDGAFLGRTGFGLTIRDWPALFRLEEMAVEGGGSVFVANPGAAMLLDFCPWCAAAVDVKG